MAMATWSERPLFGGAITCDVPTVWRDVSDIRQVPDHQECWLDIVDDGAFLVVEVMDRQSSVADAEAAGFFFRDLAEANGITNPVTNQIECTFQTIPLTPPPGGEGVLISTNVTSCSGIGVQKVALGRDVDMDGNPRVQEIRWVTLELCVVRLEQVETDLLVTITKPILASNPNEPLEEACSRIGTTFSPEFSRVVWSLNVRDWSLFGG
jgi:hypothetical protein